jgi:hypothetical protein
MNLTCQRMKLVAASAALISTIVTVTACGANYESHAWATDSAAPSSSESPPAPSSESPPAPPSESPPAAETPTSAPQSQYDQLALQILDAIVREDFDAATQPFDTSLKKRLSPEVLASGWATYQQRFGNYQSHDDPQDVKRGDLTVVNVPLQMAKMPGEFRTTFHSDGTVSGLWLLKAGVAVP